MTVTKPRSVTHAGTVLALAVVALMVLVVTAGQGPELDPDTAGQVERAVAGLPSGPSLADASDPLREPVRRAVLDWARAGTAQPRLADVTDAYRSMDRDRLYVQPVRATDLDALLDIVGSADRRLAAEATDAERVAVEAAVGATGARYVIIVMWAADR